MNILIDALPEYVEIDGIDYRIRTDFRISILFELMMQDDILDPSKRVCRALELYYPIIPEDIEAAVDAVLWFYKCGREETMQAQRMTSRRGQTRVYSFEHDADYIYAAFMTQYGIDLQEVEDLHWWKFRAMFHALTNDNEFVKIMEYRSIEISDSMSNEQKDFYRRMKRIHGLPLSKSEDERQAAIAEALINGGDMTGIL